MAKESNKTIVYSALEVANICGVVNQTAINWIRNGYLTAFCTPGGQYRVYLDDLVDFMKSRKMRIPAEILEMYTKNLDKNINVLIVDDDIGLNTVLSKYLEREFDNLEIVQAFNGFDAGAQLANKKTNCVFLDLDLPGVDGFDICRRIYTTEEFGKPVVFVITALENGNIEKQLKEMGAAEFFKKPLNLLEIATTFKKHLSI
ncbi:MAG: response regulator [Treponema sp.]|jgi:PleD family two-component response regulator|nr:response regulator [Treponema sp.]